LGYKPEFGPNAHGFDYFFGFLSGFIDFYTHVRSGDGASDLFENTTPVTEPGYMTDLITTRAVRSIQQSAARPFFLEVAYNAPHYPFQPPDRPPVRPTPPRLQTALDDPAPTRQDYASMVERVDAGVGRILATIDRLGIAANTLVVFTSDNGGEWLSRNAPLFHRKRTLWEGGIRVPAILRWPGRLPANASSAQVGITMDLTASILAAANAPVPMEAKPEGINLLPILQRQSRAVERTLFWRFNTAARRQRAVRSGEWKLLVDSDHLLLFNLRRDIGEREDRAKEHPDLVAKLSNLLSEWEKDVNAEAQAVGKGR
jgi:arylsulfatase A-like enzyme